MVPVNGSTYIIAEAGVNHNGSLEMALELVDQAAMAGANAIKFQTFKAEQLVVPNAEKAAYQKKMDGHEETQFEMLARLQLDENAHLKIRDHCQKRGIDFLSTPFDLESLTFLTQVMRLPRLKLSSGDITNGPLLLQAARSGTDLILSTGMSTLGEVEDALAVIAFGYVGGDQRPNAEAIKAAYFSEIGQQALKKHVTLMHCTTEYPCPFDEVNLRVMDTLYASFGLSIGYSDHTTGIAVAIAAVARGATVIEKHFTLDRSLPGPDHSSSLEPDELKEMVKSIRQIEKALGSPRKYPTPSELKNLPLVRKSIVAAEKIGEGCRFNEHNLAIKRPGTGLSPMKYWELLGRTSHKSYNKDELIIIEKTDQ